MGSADHSLPVEADAVTKVSPAACRGKSAAVAQGGPTRRRASAQRGVPADRRRRAQEARG
jgi:hypothetical protein